MKTRVSGVPYEVELALKYQPHTDDESIFKVAERHGWIDDFGRWCFGGHDELVGFVDALLVNYEADIATLEQENKLIRARMNRLEEEVNWLENQSRLIKDDLK
jgi:hypothetical protein